MVCVVGMVVGIKPLSQWRTKEVLLIDFISLLESHMLFTQPEEHKAVTGTSANLLRRSMDHRNGKSNRVVPVR